MSDPAQARRQMVEEQLANPPDDREPISDPRVLSAMRTVPRHLFVGRKDQPQAYADSPLDIGYGQTISQPYIVALITQAAEVSADSRVLEIGCGSGYQAAVLAELTPHVTAVELLPALAESARVRLAALGYRNVQVHQSSSQQANGQLGWPQGAPYDIIIVSAAARAIPEALFDQLAPGGRIIAPLGEPRATQALMLITIGADGRRTQRQVTLCRFVPLE